MRGRLRRRRRRARIFLHFFKELDDAIQLRFEVPNGIPLIGHLLRYVVNCR